MIFRVASGPVQSSSASHQHDYTNLRRNLDSWKANGARTTPFYPSKEAEMWRWLATKSSHLTAGVLHPTPSQGRTFLSGWHHFSPHALSNTLFPTHKGSLLYPMPHQPYSQFLCPLLWSLRSTCSPSPYPIIMLRKTPSPLPFPFSRATNFESKLKVHCWLSRGFFQVFHGMSLAPSQLSFAWWSQASRASVSAIYYRDIQPNIAGDMVVWDEYKGWLVEARPSITLLRLTWSILGRRCLLCKGVVRTGRERQIG